MQEDCELYELLRDKTFVDFFNVFLCLPIFSQRLLYRFEQNDFELDPPMKKSKYILDKTKLIKWLSTERLPLFRASPLYMEYVLCQQLMHTKLYFSVSSHRLDYEEHKNKEDKEFVHHCIGNVVGMRQFRYYLRGTVGNKLVNFWIDAELFKSIPSDDIGRKWRVFRDMQTKYFRGKNVGTYDVLKDGADILPLEEWSGWKNNYKLSVNTCYADAPREDLIQIMNSTNYTEVQNMITVVLQGYWLQRYALHSKVLKDKVHSKTITRKTIQKMLSLSDIAVLKDIKEYDKALKLLQGNSARRNELTRQKAMFNWKSMFPENRVDDTFLDEDGDIVTLHTNGTVSVDPIDPTLDEILAHYISTHISSTSGEYYSESEDPNDQLQNSIHSFDTRDTGRAASALSGLKKRGPHPDHSVVRSKPSSNEKLSPKTQLSFAELVKEAIAAKEIKTSTETRENQPPENASTRVSIHLMQKVMSSECKQKQMCLSHANRFLFDQLLELNDSQNVESRPSDVKKRPQSTPMKLMLTTTSKTKLPGIRNKTQFTSRLNAECGDTAERNTSLSVIDEQYLFPSNNNGLIVQCPESPAGTSAVIIETSVFKYKNMCEGYFRYDNQLLVLSIALDSCTGSPFESFLSKQRSKKCLNCLNFWNDAQTYLLTSVADQTVKLRRAKLLVLRFILNERIKFLPPDLSAPLQNLLPVGKGDDLLREAQDYVCKYMYKMLGLFQRNDMNRFIDVCIVKKQRLKNWTNTDTNSRPVFMDETIDYDNNMPLKNKDGKAYLKKGIAREEMYEKDDKGQLCLEKKRRLDKATQYVLDAATKLDEALPIDPIEYEELEWDSKDECGSLFVKQVALIQRRDLVEYKERLKLVAQQKKARLEMEEKKLKEQTQIFVQKDETPFYMRPFKKNGLWYQRPNRPRTFQDIIRDHVHREFFRRFLIFNTSESPMNFFNAVEELKTITEPRARQNRMNLINKKYFSSVAVATELLNTDADIIQAIPAQEKVTMAMLISAQSWVIRALNDNWFDKYQHTFPEISQTEVATGTARLLTEGVAKQFSRDRTRHLWQTVVKTVVQFRRDIHDPATVKLFDGYLKMEVRNEVDKQKLSHGYAQGMPIRKVIMNKLVDVTKIVNDLHFVAECDRFRTKTDDARHNASSGAYCLEEELLIENKAKLIIDCFVDSDIPPKCQVNLTNDLVDSIMKTYRRGLFDSSLFHAAFISIFPVVVCLWKRFQKHQFTTIYAKWLQKQTYHICEKQVKDLIPKSDVPDYVNTTLQNIITTRIIPNKGEEDICKLSFSLSKGIRMVLPVFTTTTGMSSQKDDLIDASTATLAKGPSFLQKRRYAMVSSKLGLNVDVQQKTSSVTKKSSINGPSSRFSGKHLQRLTSKPTQ